MSARRLSGTTGLLGVIGWPVEHSLSPAIHNAAIAALGLDLVYVALPVAPGAFPAAAEGLVALGLLGVNVTMPHKQAAADVVDDRSDDAGRLRAVNTIVVRDGRAIGHNTDTTGFERMLRHDEGFDPEGRTAMVFGAGGAARAVALALARAGTDRITVVARDPASASPLRDAVEGFGTRLGVVAFDGVAGARTDLVVNATPLGAAGEELPDVWLGPGVTVIDLLYRPAVTPLLVRAREAGASAAGGLGLLLHQAALSFELWTGQVPPLEIMSAAAVAAAGEHP